MKELYSDNWCLLRLESNKHRRIEEKEDTDDDDDNDDDNDNDNGVTEMEAMSDSYNNYSNIFLFHRLLCNKPLEQISVRNSTIPSIDRNSIEQMETNSDRIITANHGVYGQCYPHDYVFGVSTNSRSYLEWAQGMETNLVRIFALSASKDNNLEDGGRPRVRRFLSNMNLYFQNVTKTRILRGFQHGKVQQNGYKFNHGDSMEDDELERRT